MDPTLAPETTLPSGHSLHVAVDAGTTFYVAEGAVRIDEAPCWLADVIVPVGGTVREAQTYQASRAGWITLQAIGAARLRQLPASAGTTTALAGWFARRMKRA